MEMIHTMQRAIINKDLRGITANKQVFTTMLIVPLALTIFLPTIFVMMVHFMPLDSVKLPPLLEMLPATGITGDLKQSIIRLLLNSIMPIFFLMIPLMTSSVMAASSFIGEKEKRTLETLLYCPLSLNQIFQSKILASFLMSMFVSFVSFFSMIVVMEIEIVLTTGTLILPNLGWLITMLLIAPAISIIAITMIVRGSAKAQSMEEAQQRVMFLILPVMLLIVGQFTGVLLVNTWLMLGLGVALAVAAALFIRGVTGKFNYEILLR